MVGSPRQQEILAFIDGFIKKMNYSPSYEEIAHGVGLNAISTVHRHITALVTRGLLIRTFNANRSLELVSEEDLKERFRFEADGRLFDKVEKCYWVREKK